MKKFRLLFTLSLIIFLTISTNKQSQSCGPGLWRLDYPIEYSFYSPIPQKLVKYGRLGLTYDYYAHANYYTNNNQRNIDEWRKYFNKSVSTDAIWEVIYNTNIDDVLMIKAYIEQGDNMLSEDLQNNELIKYLKSKPLKYQEFIDYLEYTTYCAPAVRKGDYYWYNSISNIKFKTTDYKIEKQKKGGSNFSFQQDLLQKIASQYNIYTGTILKYNNLLGQYHSKFKTLDKLKVRFVEFTYTTQKEESFKDIANRFDKTYSYRYPSFNLVQWNNWKVDDIKSILVKQQREDIYREIHIKDYLQKGNIIHFTKSASKAKKGEKIDTLKYVEEKKEGSPLAHVAWDYSVDEEDLKKWNVWGNYNHRFRCTRLRGKLNIRIVRYKHQVREGDNLNKIARKYGLGTSPKSIQSLKRSIKKWSDEPQKVTTLVKVDLPFEGKKTEIYQNDLFKKGVKMKIRFDPNHISKTNLIEEGIGKVKSSKNTFIKERYTYQAIRMARYARKYEKALELYEQYIKPLQNKSMISYWALEQVAGILQRLGRRHDANYAFLQVFLNEPARARTAYKGLRIESDKDWETLFYRCKTKEEQTSLYLLRGLSWDADPLIEIDAVYDIDPESKHLELLLMKTINLLEFDLLGADLKKNNVLFIEDYKGFPKQEALKTLKELERWLQKIRQEHTFQNKDFWDLSFAYIQALNLKTSQARKTFSRLALESHNKNIVQQAKILGLMLEMSELNSVDGGKEIYFFQAIEQFKPRKRNQYRYQKSDEELSYEKLQNFMTQVFALHYNSKKDLGKITLCDTKFRVFDQKVIPNFERNEAMIKLFEKKSKNIFEKFLLKKIDTSEEKQAAFLYEMRGTILLQQNNVKKALDAFNKIPNPDKYLRKGSNPFTKELSKTNKIWNKKTVSEEILSIEKLSKKNNKKTIAHLIALGNVHFNMSWYGRSWWLTDYYITSYSSHVWLGYKSIINQDNHDLSLAKNYYEKALELAEEKKEYNLASKILFFLAKCERPNIHNKEVKKNYRAYVKRILDNYKDTAYFREVISECSNIN